LPEAGLAEKWDVAAGQQDHTFQSRHDVNWFDGKPGPRATCLFTLAVIYDPKVPNSLRPILTVEQKTRSWPRPPTITPS